MYERYLVLFAILFTGWFLRKINFIDDKMNHSMNKLIVYFAYPCLIIHNIGSLEMTKNLLKEFLIMFALSLVLFYFYGFFSKGYAYIRRFPQDSSAVAEFAMAMPNNGFIGFPVAIIFFGEEGLLLMLAHNAAMNFFIFTYGIALLKNVKNPQKEKTSFIKIVRATLKLILNPNILALLIGFAISITGLGLAGPIDEYLLYIGNVSTPMAMIFIGSSLSSYKIGETIKDRVVIESSMIKLIWLPLVTMLIVYLLPVSNLIKIITTLGIAFPTAATVPMLAQQEGIDESIGSKILFLSTMISVISVPLLINFILLPLW